jgi:protein-disulfide isomerase
MNNTRNGLTIAALLIVALLFGAPLLKHFAPDFDSGESAATLQEKSRRVAEHREQIFSDPRSPVAGNPAGDVTIVEFFDYHCTYCKAVSGPLDELLAKDKGVRLVLKEYPILAEDSVVAARAALAASAQGKYWEFHQALMAYRGKFDMPTLKSIAVSVGVDADRMEADMAAASMSEDLRGNRALGDALGVQGTPTFVIGNRIIPGALSADDLKQLIAAARKI